jgi:hypothetical protein
LPNDYVFIGILSGVRNILILGYDLFDDEKIEIVDVPFTKLERRRYLGGISSLIEMVTLYWQAAIGRTKATSSTR